MDPTLETTDPAIAKDLTAALNKFNINCQPKISENFQTQNDDEKHYLVGNNDITYRSSLGLLPVSVLANASNLNIANSFNCPGKSPFVSKDVEQDESTSLFREACRDSTFKIPPPRSMRLIEHSKTLPLGMSNDSIQGDAHLPSKYLLPVGKGIGFINNDAPNTPASVLMDERIASFVAKQNESVASTREVDWSNLFEKLAGSQNNPFISIEDAYRPHQRNKTTCPSTENVIAKYKEIDNQSFSAEALSISLANRPRSTSFGGSPCNASTNEMINTRTDGFSDFTNPPRSHFESLGVNESTVSNKIKDISYLEDSMYTQNPVTASKTYLERSMLTKNTAKNARPDEKISLGWFPAQNIGLEEFENDFNVRNNNLEFIDQAEVEFQAEHKFDQFDNSLRSDKSKNTNSKIPNLSICTPRHIDIETNAFINEQDKLSESVYFAMSTSRLGSLETTQTLVDGETSMFSMNSGRKKLSDEDRPNLGFSKIVSPKRKPISVVSTNNDSTVTLSNGQKSTVNEQKFIKEHNSTSTSLNSMNSIVSSEIKNQTITSTQDHTFKKPMLLKPDFFNGHHQNMERQRRSSSRNRHSSPIKRDKDISKENIKPQVVKNDLQINSQLRKSKFEYERPNENIALSTPALEVDNISPCGKPEFPVEVDKVILSWLAAEMGQTEEKFVSLRNLTNQTVELRLIIRECDQFSFKKDRIINPSSGLIKNLEAATTKTQPKNEVLDAVLQPNETREAIIQFSPSPNCSVGQRRGKLVIKPRGMTGKSVKASIPLYANVGIPKIVFDDSFGATAGHIPNLFTTFMGTLPMQVETTKETKIYNNGDACAFIRIQAFADMTCRVVSDGPTDPIRVEPDAFLLKPGCNETINIYVRPCHGVSEGQQIVGSMLILSGPEICRQALRTSKKNITKNDGSSNHFLVHGVDFDVPFQGENVTASIGEKFYGPLSGEEESDFQKKMTKTTVNVVGFRAKAQFVRLQVEETLSESRINCTVAGGNSFSPSYDTAVLPAICKYDPIQEEEEIEILPKIIPDCAPLKDEKSVPNTKNTNTNKASPNKNATAEHLKLKYSKLFFPPVKAGKAGAEKLFVENRGERIISVTIQSISLPFKTNYASFEVKPKSFLKLPIIYAPERIGKHRGKVVLKSDCGKVLEAILIGDSLK